MCKFAHYSYEKRENTHVFHIKNVIICYNDILKTIHR